MYKSPVLYMGDCLQVMNDIPDGSVDMVLCDLPYGITSSNAWDVRIPFEPLWKQYNRICKENAAILLFGQPPFSSEMIMSNLKNFRYEWIWEKGRAVGFLNANRMPLRATENISVFYRKLPTYNPQMRGGGKPYTRIRSGQATNYALGTSRTSTVNETGDRYPRNILHFDRGEMSKSNHPTEKPVMLLEYFIKTYTNEGEMVLDNCMGSGSTGVACVRTNRNFIGIEINEQYFQVANERIKMEEMNHATKETV